jgi:hypothetical protein
VRKEAKFITAARRIFEIRAVENTFQKAAFSFPDLKSFRKYEPQVRVCETALGALRFAVRKTVRQARHIGKCPTRREAKHRPERAGTAFV